MQEKKINTRKPNKAGPQSRSPQRTAPSANARTPKSPGTGRYAVTGRSTGTAGNRRAGTAGTPGAARTAGTVRSAGTARGTGTGRTAGTARTSAAAGSTSSAAKARNASAGSASGSGVSNRQRQRINAVRRKKTVRKRVMILVLAVIAAAAAVFIVRALMNTARIMEQEKQAKENKTSAGITIMVSDVTHLSFPQLSVTKGEGRLSVEEFTDILEDLYYSDYVLVDVYDLAETKEDGTLTLSDVTGLQDFPEGKHPLIISERDASYPFSRIGSGYGKKLTVDAEGNILCDYDQIFGQGSIEGDYDLVPVVESFIAEHPDFSYNGARGVLALSGYNGILGYRTAPCLSGFENNPYAETYGLFDTEIEKEGAVQTAQALKERGWHFALYGYSDISYGSDSTIVKPDIDQWMEEVSPLIGGTDLCIFPQSTDIGSWEPYNADNVKYSYLKEKGFSYFFTKTGTESLLQIRDDYVREGIFEINTAEDYASFSEDRYQ